MKQMLKWAALALLAAACQVEEHGEAPHANDGHDAEVHASNASMPMPENQGDQQAEKLEADSLATFAGGCFWCMEKPFEHVPGVTAVISGFIDGHVENPSYDDVCTGKTGHTEAVEVHYDSRRIRYEDLLQIYWRQFDPTDAGGSFHDRGSQYRSGIYTHGEAQRLAAEKSKQELAASGRFDKPIVTEIKPATKFYAAEDYHQDFYLKDPKRYTSYRAGSGRDRFIDRIWGDDREYVPKSMSASASAPWMSFKKPSEAKLREELTSLQYEVTQEEGTERPFNNEYWDNKQAGLYVDIVSGEPLFSSRDKFKSGTGWPSFTRPVRKDSLEFDTDQKLGYTRDEVRSRYADSHLGHVFKDGPAPTGLRYCINSAALRFIPKEELAAKGYADFLSEVE